MLYTTVLHDVRRRLDLSCNEYCVADIIYKLSSNPGAPVTGWCNQSRKNMADEMGLSRRTIIDIINTLVEKNLVEKNDVDYVQTTQKWYDATVSAQGEIEAKRGQKDRGAESAQGVQILHGGCAESSQDGCADSAHNNKSIDNKIDNTTTTPKKNEPVASAVVDSLPKESITLPFNQASALIEKHRADILAAQIAKERECMVYKISLDYYDLLTNAFFDQQLSDAERNVPIEFYRIKKHFDNWLRKQVSLGNQSNYHPAYKPPPPVTGSGYRSPINGHGGIITAKFHAVTPD